MSVLHEGISYSERYYDDIWEYRHVVLPPDIDQILPKGRLLSEAEVHNLGVRQSRGWNHYGIHRPEPHILLFRRAKGYQQNNARVAARPEQAAGSGQAAGPGQEVHAQ